MVLLSGRYHLYQGLSAAHVGAPVRAIAELGVVSLILTNAAGGLNPSYHVGDLMLIRDHLNLPGMAGGSPFVPASPVDPVEFVSMRDAYAGPLRAIEMVAAAEAEVDLREGGWLGRATRQPRSCEC